MLKRMVTAVPAMLVVLAGTALVAAAEPGIAESAALSRSELPGIEGAVAAAGDMGFCQPA